MYVHAGKLLKVNFTFPQTHPEILLERSCSNNIYPCSNYWWAILWKDQAKQLCKLIQWGGKKILDIHICEWEQKWSWADVEGLSLKTKALIQSKFLDRYFESKIYLSSIFGYIHCEVQLFSYSLAPKYVIPHTGGQNDRNLPTP